MNSSNCSEMEGREFPEMTYIIDNYYQGPVCYGCTEIFKLQVLWTKNCYYEIKVSIVR